MRPDSTAAADEPQQQAVSRSASADRETGLADSGPGGDTPAGGVLLSLRGISKHFGPVIALDDVNLEVPAGRITALIGDNGAGKSTLIKVIAGIHEADGGELHWNGELA